MICVVDTAEKYSLSASGCQNLKIIMFGPFSDYVLTSLMLISLMCNESDRYGDPKFGQNVAS